MTQIAIVGMDGRFPQAPDLDALWRLLLAGEDGIGEVPAGRWPVADYYDADGGPGTSNTRNAGFLTDADAFDHEFFAIAPSEAAAMDPQQRLLLQTAWRALEDATLDPRAAAGSNTGVYVGVMASEWSSVRLTDFARITAHHGAGAGYFMSANRLSYHLDLKGPSLAVDTACSSSLVAVQQACAALRTGACDQALAGGVNLVLTPALSIFYTQAGLSAPDGRCKPFSARADGIGRGEGVALLVLRRLADAVDAGLPIYAVIEGGAVNSDGRSNGITAPNRWAQKQVVLNACRDAGVGPEQIDFVEAHGTGTVLGDMIEVKALGDVHGRRSGRETPCAIGSIKGNIGHTEGAAGVAGLVKAALSLHHGILPPSRFADEPNPQLRLADNGLRLAEAPVALPGDVVRAGVSSFGIGGTNAHMVLASAPATPAAAADAPPARAIFTVSSASRAGLGRAAARLAGDLDAAPAERFGQLAWSSNRIKASGRHRLAICAHDRDGAAAALREAANDDEASLSAVSGVARGISAGWLFTGQGSQYPGMSRALHDSCAAYRDALAAVDDAMAPHLGRSIRELMFTADEDTINRTEFAQPAIFALEYAVAVALATVGVVPAWMIGHSVGEFAAAVIAGVFELADASALIVARGRLMQALPSGGGMLAVRLDEAQAADLIAGEPALGLAAVNGPREVVISGEASALDRVRTELSERGVDATRLAVSHAFHSPLMAPAAAAFAEVAAGFAFRAPELPIYSTVRGRLLGFDEPMDAGYWVEQITAPVRFADAAGEALQADPSHLLEIGPRRILAPMMTRIQPDSAIPSLLACPGPAATGDELDEVVAALYRDGLNPDWDALSEPEQRVPRRLSGYAFSTERRFWLQAAPPGPAAAPPAPQTAANPVTVSGEDPTMDQLIALFREQNAVLAALANNGGVAATSAAPDRPSPPSAAGAAQIAATVRAQAAVVSGFPVDALRDSHSLTGDLGFDSIMVTDLAGRITQALPGVTFDPGAFTWELTLGDLVAHLAGHAGGVAVPADADAAVPPVASAADPASLVAPVAEESRIEDFPEVREMAERLRGAAALGLENPYFLVNDGVTRDTSVIAGNETINFSSYNYLGLSGHPVVTAAVQDAVARYGSSVSSSRLLSGEKPVHQELEGRARRPARDRRRHRADRRARHERVGHRPHRRPRRPAHPRCAGPQQHHGGSQAVGRDAAAVPARRRGGARRDPHRRAPPVPPGADRRRGRLQPGRRHRRSAGARRGQAAPPRAADDRRGAQPRRARRDGWRHRRAFRRRPRRRRAVVGHAVEVAGQLRRVRRRQPGAHRVPQVHDAGLHLQRRHDAGERGRGARCPAPDACRARGARGAAAQRGALSRAGAGGRHRHRRQPRHADRPVHRRRLAEDAAALDRAAAPRHQRQPDPVPGGARGAGPAAVLPDLLPLGGADPLRRAGPGRGARGAAGAGGVTA
jgi:acyl transferase domain-containing protein